jgi:hypothetical protein
VCAGALTPETLQTAAIVGLDGLLSPGCKALAHALRTQRVPSVTDLLLTLRQPMVRCDSSVPYAPVTPGYRCVCLRQLYSRALATLGALASSLPILCRMCVGMLGVELGTVCCAALLALNSARRQPNHGGTGGGNGTRTGQDPR